MLNDLVVSIFGENLMIRRVDALIATKINFEDLFFIEQLGMPNTDNFTFNSKVEYLPDIKCVKLGTMGKEFIVYNYISREVYLKDSNIFLASSIKNFVYQLAEVELFWKDTWLIKPFGETKNSLNRRFYSEYLENKLKEIDFYLFEKDLGYYWGSMIESIELGIVG